MLLVGIHEAALNAPESPHTQLLGFQHGELTWAGALSEASLRVEMEGGGDPRVLLGEAVGVGSRLGDVIWPGKLTSPTGPTHATTTYQGERPWVVLGETALNDLLAAPLNESGNPKWYTPLLGREEILFPGSSKDAQLELAHLWSFPASLAAIGSLAPGAQERVLEAVKSYF